jgi:DNA uptake protein ComE-like DNA-binding protein
MSRREREKAAAQLRRLDLTLALALLPLAALTIARCAGTEPVEPLLAAGDSAPAAAPVLDPNTAPWWELMALPGIGETRARAIADYREQVRAERRNPADVVFRQVGDLQAVKGVGPKTAERIAPYLKFPTP